MRGVEEPPLLIPFLLTSSVWELSGATAEGPGLRLHLRQLGSNRSLGQPSCVATRVRPADQVTPPPRTWLLLGSGSPPDGAVLCWGATQGAHGPWLLGISGNATCLPPWPGRWSPPSLGVYMATLSHAAQPLQLRLLTPSPPCASLHHISRPQALASCFHNKAYNQLLISHGD